MWCFQKHAHHPNSLETFNTTVHTSHAPVIRRYSGFRYNSYIFSDPLVSKWKDVLCVLNPARSPCNGTSVRELGCAAEEGLQYIEDVQRLSKVMGVRWEDFSTFIRQHFSSSEFVPVLFSFSQFAKLETFSF